MIIGSMWSDGSWKEPARWSVSRPKGSKTISATPSKAVQRYIFLGISIKNDVKGRFLHEFQVAFILQLLLYQLFLGGFAVHVA